MTEWLRGISLVSTLLGYLDVIDTWLGKCRWVSGYLLGLRLAYEQLLYYTERMFLGKVTDVCFHV